MANGKSKKVQEWKPSGKYKNVDPNHVCSQLEILTLWVKFIRARGGYPSQLPRGKKPNGASPPRFP